MQSCSRDLLKCICETIRYGFMLSLLKVKRMINLSKNTESFYEVWKIKFAMILLQLFLLKKIGSLLKTPKIMSHVQSKRLAIWKVCMSDKWQIYCKYHPCCLVVT